MKTKFLVTIGIFICAIALLNCVALADDIKICVDNIQIKNLTDANGTTVYPFIENGTTYVPIRAVSNALNCNIKWDQNQNAVLLFTNGSPGGFVYETAENSVKKDELRLYVDNMLVELRDANGNIVYPIIINGTTYVPVRGVSQLLNCQVRWDGETKTVLIYKNIVPPDGVSLTGNMPYYGMNSTAYYESGSHRLEIGDKKYTNALLMGINSYQVFNLSKKYNKLTCVIGAVRDFETAKTLTFFVDEREVANFTIEPNSPPQLISVDLFSGKMLKIAANATTDSLALGDIMFLP